MVSDIHAVTIMPTDLEKKMVKINLNSAAVRSVTSEGRPAAVRSHTLPITSRVSSKKMSEKSANSTQSRVSLMRLPADSKKKSSLKSAQGGGTDQLTSQAKKISLPNASIFSILLSRRLAKNYVARFRQGRQLAYNAPKPPTYQLTPHKPFNCLEIQPLIKKIVDGRMRTFRYNPNTAALLTKILTSECKDAVKSLKLDRYKVVCQVVLGQKQIQGMSVNSQCAWDTNTDNVVSYSWESPMVYCTVMVYGIYHE